MLGVRKKQKGNKMKHISVRTVEKKIYRREQTWGDMGGVGFQCRVIYLL